MIIYVDYIYIGRLDNPSKILKERKKEERKQIIKKMTANAK